MTTAKLTIQSEISLNQLHRIITQLPWKQRLELAEDIKREALREQWRTLSDTLPDVPELNEDEILVEVKAARTSRLTGSLRVLRIRHGLIRGLCSCVAHEIVSEYVP